jgi:hypothetical protein
MGYTYNHVIAKSVAMWQSRSQCITAWYATRLLMNLIFPNGINELPSVGCPRPAAAQPTRGLSNDMFIRF